MRFDRRLFYVNYRKHFGGLSTQQVAGLNRLLDGIENDPHIPAEPTGIFYASYMLATVKRETAHTFMPIHEYGSHAYFVRRYGGQTKKGRELGNDTPEEGYFYRGASDVQVTGESNFEKVEDAIRREYPNLVTDFERRTGKTFDLTVGDQSGDEHDPDNILDPKISYAVMSYGMRTGLFTGKKLSQFIKNGVPNYKGMRTIINGHDHDDEIAADAKAFEIILTKSLTTETFNNDIASEVGITALSGASTEQNVPPTSSDLPTDDRPLNTAKEGSAGKPDPPPPVEVKASTPSTFTKIGTAVTGFFAMLATYGINAGNAIQGKLEQITLNQVLLTALFLALAGVAILWYDRSSKRAQERTMKYVDNALDPTTPDLKVV